MTLSISTLFAKYLYDECHILSFVFHIFVKLNVECCFVECRVAVLNVVVPFMCCVCVCVCVCVGQMFFDEMFFDQKARSHQVPMGIFQLHSIRIKEKSSL
jgi:hypothetical protein